jgi:hypothetical protein
LVECLFSMTPSPGRARSAASSPPVSAT